MNREPEALLHELDYWKLALDDLLAINTLVQDAADTLMEAPVALVEVAVIASISPSGRLQERLTVAGESVGKTMKVLGTMHEPLDRLLALIDGRFHALKAELDE